MGKCIRHKRPWLKWIICHHRNAISSCQRWVNDEGILFFRFDVLRTTMSALPVEPPSRPASCRSERLSTPGSSRPGSKSGKWVALFTFSLTPSHISTLSLLMPVWEASGLSYHTKKMLDLFVFIWVIGKSKNVAHNFSVLTRGLNLPQIPENYFAISAENSDLRILFPPFLPQLLHQKWYLGDCIYRA